MAISVSIIAALEGAQKNFFSNPTEATATALAKALTAKEDARKADVTAGGNKPKTSGLSVTVPYPADSSLGIAAEAAWHAVAAQGLFPAGARLVFQSDTRVFETSGFNAMMRGVYEAPEVKAVQALCTPEWFAALASIIGVCKRAGAPFGYVSLMLDAADKKAKAFKRLWSMYEEEFKLPFLIVATDAKVRQELYVQATLARKREVQTELAEVQTPVGKRKPYGFDPNGPFAKLSEMRRG